VPETDEGHAYFQAVEDIFLRLRGKGTLLSPADNEIARRWFEEGVPLELVHRCMEESFAGFHERGVKRRTGARREIDSLRYCARAVDAAWAEIRDMSAAGIREEAAPLDIPSRLAALADALPASLAGREDWRRRIHALLGDPPTVEEALSRIDREILEAAEAALAEGERTALAGEVETTLEHLAARLPALELELARQRLSAQALRRRLSLPLLSLFSPEAERTGEGGAG